MSCSPRLWFVVRALELGWVPHRLPLFWQLGCTCIVGVGFCIICVFTDNRTAHSVTLVPNVIYMDER